MFDLLMQPTLSSILINSPDIRFMATLTFAVIVGLSLSLVILNTILRPH